MSFFDSFAKSLNENNMKMNVPELLGCEQLTLAANEWFELFDQFDKVPYKESST